MAESLSKNCTLLLLPFKFSHRLTLPVMDKAGTWGWKPSDMFESFHVLLFSPFCLYRRSEDMQEGEIAPEMSPALNA